MTKIPNVYIVYHLDALPENSTKISNLKIACLERPNIVKTSDKEKNVYSGYGTTFDSADSCRFDNDIAGNVIAFDVANK